MALTSTVALAFFAWLPLSTQPTPAPQESPLGVTVAEVRRDTLHDRLEALGTTRANESVDITTKVTALIVNVHFDDGQHLKQGDRVVTLAQEAEQAQRAAALEELAQHRRELRRLETLINTQVEAQRAYDERKTLLAVTQQRVREIDSSIEDRIVRAPFDGVLGLRHVSVGALVEPGDIIATIDDISQIKLDFAIPDTFLQMLREGTEARASHRAVGGFRGTLTKIDSRVDPQTRSVVVRAVLPNPDHKLKPGMLMDVMLLNNRREALMIPEEALIPLQRQHSVLVVNVAEGRTVQRRTVQIGTRRLGEVEIREGLSEGELVIVEGTTRVRPGDQVELAATRENGPRQSSGQAPHNNVES
ncbi:MAG: efflux RND transporter periplasmic adaptor subunit [Gammaproteobacteria bacterium]